LTRAEVEPRAAEIDDDEGSGVLSDIFIAEAADTPGMREWLGKIQRSMHTPTMARLTSEAFECRHPPRAQRHSCPHARAG
jgi:hypothetical protein